MERNEIILTVVLSTLAALVSMGLTFLLCYWCSRRKHKRRADELETLQFMLSADGGSAKDGNRELLRGNSLDPQQQGKGSLRLKSPFIRTKPVKSSKKVLWSQELSDNIKGVQSKSEEELLLKSNEQSLTNESEFDGTEKLAEPSQSDSFVFNSTERNLSAGKSLRKLSFFGLRKKKYEKRKRIKDKSYENAQNSHQEQTNGQAKAQAGSAKDVVGAMQFWQNRSLSQLDMFIDQSEPTENCGQIQFSLEYDFQTSTLILKIIQAKDLPAKDLSGTSDPYVRVTLLPDKKHRLETKIKRRTLHPRWNETFYFEGFPIQKLQSRVLHLHVFDYDRFSRDDSIGEVHIPLCQVDMSEKPVFWKALKPLLKDKCGEIFLSLCYHPNNGQLTISIVKAKNLKAKDITGKSDPYVKVWMQHGDKRVEKKKTCIIKRTLNPVYNEAFTFNVPWERLRETALVVSVMDFDSVGRNELIGKIVMSSKGGVTEGKHWNEMISKPRQTVSQWHRLKPE